MPKGIQQPIVFNTKELSDLYVSQNLSIYKIAALASVKRGVVRRWLRVYNIETRKKSTPPPKDILHGLYEDCGMTLTAISERYGVDRNTVKYWLIKHSISLRKKNVEPLKAEELRRLYETERLTIYQIAEQVGVSSTTVGVWLRDYDITRRPPGNGLVNRGITPPSKHELEQLVHSEHLSYEQIATMFGVDLTAVPYWLKKHGIPRPKAWDTRYKGKNAELPTVEQITALYDTGASIEQIADQLGVTKGIVHRLCREFGILLRPDGWNGGKRHLCKDRHKVRSTYELRVDNWLYEHGVPHVYEPSVPFNNLSHADFLANGWYIEVWGVTGSASYNERKKHKTTSYRQHNLPLIEIPAHAFNKDQNGLWERRLARCLTTPSLP